MGKRGVIVAVTLGLIAAAICTYVAVRATSQTLSYGQAEVVDAVLNSAGDRLYVSYYRDNAVVEIDTSTMEELRRFSVHHPMFIELSPWEDYVYALCGDVVCRLCRVRISDGATQSLQVEGYSNDFCIDPSGERLWVVSSVWPAHGELFDEDDYPYHPDTGRLTEVELPDFEVSRVVPIDPLPVSVWYSEYSDFIYVLHSGRFLEVQGPYEWTMSNMVRVVDPDSLRKIDEFRGGLDPPETCPPAQLEDWSDDGRYLAIPDPAPGSPPKSIRVVDTADNSVAYDLSFLADTGYPLGMKYVHKVPGMPYLWASSHRLVHDQGLEGQGRTVVRVNTETQVYEFFLVEGVTGFFGDFAVSPDGNTLYLPVIDTGEIVVWSPDE